MRTRICAVWLLLSLGFITLTMVLPLAAQPNQGRVEKVIGSEPWSKPAGTN
jgi:hypothetical protein